LHYWILFESVALQAEANPENVLFVREFLLRSLKSVTLHSCSLLIGGRLVGTCISPLITDSRTSSDYI